MIIISIKDRISFNYIKVNQDKSVFDEILSEIGEIKKHESNYSKIINHLSQDQDNIKIFLTQFLQSKYITKEIKLNIINNQYADSDNRSGNFFIDGDGEFPRIEAEKFYKTQISEDVTVRINEDELYIDLNDSVKNFKITEKNDNSFKWSARWERQLDVDVDFDYPGIELLVDFRGEYFLDGLTAWEIYLRTSFNSYLNNDYRGSILFSFAALESLITHLTESLSREVFEIIKDEMQNLDFENFISSNYKNGQIHWEKGIQHHSILQDLLNQNRRLIDEKYKLLIKIFGYDFSKDIPIEDLLLFEKIRNQFAHGQNFHFSKYILSKIKNSPENFSKWSLIRDRYSTGICQNSKMEEVFPYPSDFEKLQSRIGQRLEYLKTKTTLTKDELENIYSNNSDDMDYRQVYTGILVFIGDLFDASRKMKITLK